MMDQLSEKVFRFTTSSTSFRTPSTVVIGVSGGADSMCLLHMACSWREFGVYPVAVHIHHGIRGEEAQRDENFVREQCRLLQAPLYVVRADVPMIATAERCGFEEAGRLVRYAVFEEIKKQANATYVFTAHTASDTAETVLLNILRGCGIAGLCGIPVCRGAILRPLLQCTREQIEDYCAAHNVPHVTDSSNTDTHYTRNMVRHRVLPLLRNINPSADHALLRLSRAAARDNDFLQNIAIGVLSEARFDDGTYSRKSFLPQQDAIRYRMLRSALEETGCHSMEERHFLLLNKMIDVGQGSVDLPGGYCVYVTDCHISVSKKRHAAKPPNTLTVQTLPFCSKFGDYILHLSVYSRQEYEELEKVHKKFFKCALDYDTIQGSLQIRCRRPGDYMHPAARGVGKSLKALMSEWRIPIASRDTFPILCDSKGVILLPGLCCEERVRVQNHTKHLLVCFIEHLST